MISIELNEVFKNALSYAKEQRHEYLTLEHIFLSILSSKDGQVIFEMLDVDIDGLEKAIASHIHSKIPSIPSDNIEPFETPLLSKAINEMIHHINSSGKDSATIGGTLHITGSSPIVVTANFVVEENSKTYKLQDTTIKIWDGVSYGQFELSGRFYDHDYGYVDVVTNTRFKVSNSSYWPYDGKLTITGNNSSATITANNSTTYTVVITENNTVTDTTTHNWSEL
jgi:ATP-dependent Clp protease ATP-binding subunit ClpA